MEDKRDQEGAITREMIQEKLQNISQNNQFCLLDKCTPLQSQGNYNGMDDYTIIQQTFNEYLLFPRSNSAGHIGYNSFIHRSSKIVCGSYKLLIEAIMICYDKYHDK